MDGWPNENAFPAWENTITPTSEPHRIDSSLAFLISPPRRFEKHTCRALGFSIFLISIFARPIPLNAPNFPHLSFHFNQTTLGYQDDRLEFSVQAKTLRNSTKQTCALRAALWNIPQDFTDSNLQRRSDSVKKNFDCARLRSRRSQCWLRFDRRGPNDDVKRNRSAGSTSG
jgi:hypothetical protein